eukprot:356479-Chlamydomonas_euryale.AAC.1
MEGTWCVRSAQRMCTGASPARSAPLPFFQIMHADGRLLLAARHLTAGLCLLGGCGGRGVFRDVHQSFQTAR